MDNLAEAVGELDSKGVKHEPIRTDEYTGKQFVFFSDPDGLPIELYESKDADREYYCLIKLFIFSFPHTMRLSRVGRSDLPIGKWQGRV